MDDVDRALFAWSDLPGWTSLAGWQGQDMYHPQSSFTLEEVTRGTGEAFERRGILHKWHQFGAEKYHVKPADNYEEDDFIEACQQLGYSSYRTEPKEDGGWWIIPESVDDRPIQISKSRRVERKSTKGDGL